MFYVFLAEGFEETEALAPVDVMRRAKLDVKTVGVTGECVTSSHGVPVKADITIDNIDLDDVQGVVLPGGMPGTLNLEANEKVLEAVKYSCENGKIVAAICAAPSILGHLGILDGKKATCFPGFEKELKGADYTGAHCNGRQYYYRKGRRLCNRIRSRNCFSRSIKGCRRQGYR